MNIPPLPPTTIASLAGSDRAASANIAQSSSAERASANAASNAKLGKNVDSIDKGNASDDKDADGRQLLDTFERQKQKDEDPKDQTKTSKKEIGSSNTTQSVRGHIDFTA